MSRLATLGAIVVAAAGVLACGGKSSSSPTAPSATTTSITVTVASPLRMGQTTQATGTETLSNGQTQPITSGWLSDTPGVATVTSAGVVTGVANGRATIYVISGGRQGQQVVRVVPDYQGKWTVVVRVASCTQSGIFGDAGWCDVFAVGERFSLFLDFSHAGEQVTATVDYGEGLVFAPVSTPIREDGSLNFDVAASVVEEGLTVTVDSTFTLNSARVGQLTGVNTDVYRFPNIPGEARVGYDIVSASRSGAASLGAAGPTKAAVMRRLSRAGAGGGGLDR